MDPTEFNWTEEQQVLVVNPTGELFRWMVHGKEYELDAGMQAKMPGYIAWLFVYNMAVKLAQADEVFTRWNEEDFRQTYYNRVVVGADDLITKIEVQPQVEVISTDGDTITEQAPDTPIPGTGENYQPSKASNVKSSKV